MWKRSAGSGVSQSRHWVPRGRPGLWTHRDDHGLCHRAYLRLSSQPGCFPWPLGRKTIPGVRSAPLHHSPGVGGGILGAGILYLIASGKAGFDLSAGLASNGYGDHSPGKYSLLSGFVSEVVLTLMFLMIIVGSTDRRAPKGFAPIAIGLGLTLIHLIGIPVTNVSVNPARSTGPAVFVGGWALSQLWLFWVAPIIGSLLGGIIYRSLAPGGEEKES